MALVAGASAQYRVYYQQPFIQNYAGATPMYPRMIAVPQYPAQSYQPQYYPPPQPVQQFYYRPPTYVTDYAGATQMYSWSVTVPQYAPQVVYRRGW